MVPPQLKRPPGSDACQTLPAHGLHWRRLLSAPDAACWSGGGCLSILGLGEIVHRALGDGFRAFLMLTVVLVFLQFLLLLRRFS